MKGIIILGMLNYLKYWVPGVNFIHVPAAPFFHKDPKRPKKTDNLTVIFCAFGIC